MSYQIIDQWIKVTVAPTQDHINKCQTTIKFQLIDKISDFILFSNIF